jgi:cytochrome bd ubiquinol oxidase subunit I
MSSFWIIAVNSWMQTPQGFELRDGRFVPSWLRRSSIPPSLTAGAHGNAFVVTAAFVVLAVGAGYLLRGRHVAESRVMVKMTLGCWPSWCRCRWSSATCTA